MRARSLSLLLVAALIASDDVVGQAPDSLAAQTAIAQLDFMVGHWRGEAWQLRGNERVQTQMVETVEQRLGGAVLLVEGRGTLNAAAEERVVHHALGIISFDAGSGSYSLRSYIASGQSGDFALILLEDGVSWTRQVPGGTIRNTAHFTTDEWHEVGEFSPDGTTWRQVMEMRLRRVR